MALHCAADKKGLDPVLLDLRGIADFTDFFLIVSGTSEKQVQAISDEIEERLKKELGESPINIEGYRSAEWILMDYGDFIVHIFHKDAREFYDLERLWRDAKRISLPENL
ncbi:MAG: ribosome silencing factor [Acidobacteria bacterium]|nr:MAG: ribosome silencing factor [Acidobacteriota bacterium]